MLWHRSNALPWIVAAAVAAFLLAKWQPHSVRGSREAHTWRSAAPESSRPVQPHLLAAGVSSPVEMATPIEIGPSASREMSYSHTANALERQPLLPGEDEVRSERTLIREPLESVPVVTRVTPTLPLGAAPVVNERAGNSLGEVITSPRGQASPSIPSLPEAVLRLEPNANDTQPSQVSTPALAEPTPLGAEMKPVNQLARQHVLRGFSLGDRSAIYAARVEFMQGLRTVGQAVDAHRGLAPNDPSSCSHALARALQALREVDDFAPEGGKLAADIDVARHIAAHRTPAGKDNPPITQMAAMQCYFDYARGQLITAAAGNEVASQALAGLGKCCVNDPKESTRGLGPAKAMVFHQAALAADASNHLSANELGVLLGQYGQWQDAKRLFLQAARVQEDAATWQNLAVAHSQLGETDLARLALSEYRRLETTTPNAQRMGIDGTPTVQWVDPRAFGGPPDDNRPAPALPVASRSMPRSSNVPNTASTKRGTIR